MSTPAPATRLHIRLLQTQEARTAAIRFDSKSTFTTPAILGWFRSIFLSPKAKSLDKVWAPWLFITLLSICLTVIFGFQGWNEDDKGEHLDNSFYTYAVTTTLALMLVFRLNRAALRWWVAREFWGAMMAYYRNFSSSAIINAVNKQQAEESIRWLLAFVICTKCQLRGSKLQVPQFSGILTPEEIDAINNSKHKTLNVLHSARKALHRAFDGDGKNCVFASLLEIIDNICAKSGGLERINGTPLPLAFVSHLRFFVFLYLLYFSVVTALYDDWGQVGGVLLTVLVSYCLLVIDAIASDSEAPFSADRPHHIDIDNISCSIINQCMQILAADEDEGVKI